MPPIRAIVFDFGNVVGFFDHRRAARRLAALGNLASEDVYRHLFGSPLEEDYDSGRLSTPEFIAHVRRLCGLRCTDAELASAYADIFWPNQEVIALLPHLPSRYRLLLGSNTNELHALHFSRQFALALRPFHELVFSYQVGTCKPQAAFFDHCRCLAGCEASACVFIDDLPANVEGARARGWHGIRFTDAVALRQELSRLGIEGLEREE